MEGDAQFIERLRSADPAVFDDIDKRFSSELQIFCQRMVFDVALSEDIVQEVMMRCCKADAAQIPTGSLRGWLCRVPRNRCIDDLRKRHAAVRVTATQTARAQMRPGVIPIDKGSTPAG